MARELARSLGLDPRVEAVEVAPSGLLLITLTALARGAVVDAVLAAPDAWALGPGSARAADRAGRARSPGDPVRQAQVAHARLCRLVRNAEALGVQVRGSRGREALVEVSERRLLVALADLPQRAAAPGDAVTDLARLADDWRAPVHPQVVGASVERVHGARLGLATAARVVLRNGLWRLGAAPRRGCEDARTRGGGAPRRRLPGPRLAADPRRRQRARALTLGAVGGSRRRRRAQRRWPGGDELAREFGTPAYVIDEDDFRARARDFKATYADVFAELSGADVFYAGKAFLCTEVARWVNDEGLHLDVCSGGELAVAIRAGVPGDRIGMHGNNKSVAEIRAALQHGVSRIVVDSFEEIDRVAASPSELGVVAPVLIRVTVGVEAHTHEFIATAHEDQKFGLSLSGGQAFEAARRILERPTGCVCSACTATSGPRSSTPRASRSRLAGSSACTPGSPTSSAPSCRSSTSVAASASPTRPSTTRSRPGARRRAWPRSSPRVPGRGLAGAEDLHRAGARHRRAEHLHPLRGRHGQGGGPRRRRLAGSTSSVDGGMSDNMRTALYDANYSCTLANRASPARRRSPGSSASTARAATSSSRTSSSPATSRAGDLLAVPGTGAYCRACRASTTTPRARRSSPSGTAGRVIVRRETIDDLLALDV